MIDLHRKSAPSIRQISQFNVPDIDWSVNKNGQSFYHHYTPEIGVVIMVLWFPKGIINQTKNFQCTASFEMLFSGSETKTEKDIIGYIDHLGASISTESSVLTSSITIRSTTENASKALKWIIENLNEAIYPENEFSNYLPVKKASLERKMQSPNYWADRIAKENYYGKNNVLGNFGDINDLTNLSRTDLMQFKNEHIRLNESMFLVSGDCNEHLLTELLEIQYTSNNHKSFAILTPDANYSPVIPETPLIHSMENVSQASMCLLKHLPHTSESEIHKLTLLNLVLGGYFGSRLMQELREKRGLTYGINSHFRPALSGRTWIISGEMNSENAMIALDVTLEIMQELTNDTVKVEELDKAKSYFSGQFRSGFDGPFSRMQKCQHLILRDHSKTYFTDTLKNIWRITPEELMLTAQNVFQDNTFIKVVSGSIA